MRTRIIFRVVFCLAVALSLKARAAQTDSLNIFTLERDTLFMRMGESLRLWGDADVSDDTLYLYRWNTGDRTNYIDIKDTRRREQWVWCQRVSAEHWEDEIVPPGDTVGTPDTVSVYTDCYNMALDTASVVDIRVEWNDSVCLCMCVDFPSDALGMMEREWSWVVDYEVSDCTDSCIRIGRGEGNTVTVTGRLDYRGGGLNTGSILSTVRVIFNIPEHDGGHHDKGRGGGSKVPVSKSPAAGVDTFSYNVFHMESDSLWVGLSDVVRLSAEWDSVLYPEDSVYSAEGITWGYGYPFVEHWVTDTLGMDFAFDGRNYVLSVFVERYFDILPPEGPEPQPDPEVTGPGGKLELEEPSVQRKTVYIFWGIDPYQRIETDSVLIVYPQYAYSDLGGDTLFCLPYDSVYAATDTILEYNLGPANRGLYVSYQWLLHDTVAGEDSVFHVTFGMLDTLKENVYQGELLVRVAVDTVVFGVWVSDTLLRYDSLPVSDTAWAYDPVAGLDTIVWVRDSVLYDSVSYDTLVYREMREYCDTCFIYDTIRIRVVHSAYKEDSNAFLPYDTLLCAHLDMTLRMNDTDYHAWWLDKDSVEMPYGDSVEFTFHGVRGVDTVGGGTDTREKVRYYLRVAHHECPWVRLDSLDIIHLVQPQLELRCHDTLICRNEPVTIGSWHNLVYADAYEMAWTGEANSTGSGQCDCEDVQECKFSVGGTFIAAFRTKKDYDVCGYDTAFDTINVVWVDPVMTDIYLPSDTGVCERLKITFNVKNSFRTIYEWRTGTAPTEDGFEEESDSVLSYEPTYTVSEDGNFNVTLTDTMMCLNTAHVAVSIEDCTPKIEIPNVFTPNSDGHNDVWRFKTLEKCVDVEIQVVNRWGILVLKQAVKRAEDFSWNGCLNNGGKPLPDGPYFYMVSYKDMYGKKKVQSGSVSILGSSER